MEAAENESELRQAVGDIGTYGLYAPLADGEWIAICYGDSHDDPGWSSSVALDSGGRWRTSNFHFCGTFEVWSADLERLELATTAGERQKIEDDVESYGFSSSTILSETRKILVDKFAFRNVNRRMPVP